MELNVKLASANSFALLQFNHSEVSYEPDSIVETMWDADGSNQRETAKEMQDDDTADLSDAFSKRLEALLGQDWRMVSTEVRYATDRDLALLDRLPARAGELAIERCELASIPPCPGVRSLNVEVVDGMDLSALATCDALTTLSITGKSSEALQLPALPGSIKALTILRCELASLSFLEACSDLTSLFLSLQGTSAPSLEPLGKLARLRTLKIISKKSKLKGEHLAALRSVEDLTLKNVALKKTTLSDLTELKCLSIDNCGLKDLTSISQALKIESLSAGKGCTSLEGVEQLERLGALELYDSKVTSLAPALGAPLRELSLPDHCFDLAEIDRLLPKPGLKIEFRGKSYAPERLRALLDGTLVLPTFADTALSAYVPKIGKKGSSSRSHFGGDAFLGEGEPWPTCGHCSEPLKLFVQLDLNELAKEDLAGLLQLFYCTNDNPRCETECSTFHGQGDAHLLRVLTNFSDAETKSPSKALTQRVIIGLDEKKDHPTSDDATELFDLDEELYREKMLGKDKAFGWPIWIQGPEWPSCPECAERMTHLFQLESKKRLAYTFGDNGRAHLFVCRNHLDRTRLIWQCY